MDNLYIPDCISAQYTNSIAYYTLKEKLPVVLNRLVNDINKDTEVISQQYGATAKEDIKFIIRWLQKLKLEMEADKPLAKLSVYSEDVALWNTALAALNKDILGIAPTWITAPWLFVENYMYRRIYEIFRSSVRLRDYDYFKKQKDNLFLSSLDSATTLATHLLSIVSACKEDFQIREYFCDLLTISLWSNRCDYSNPAGGENGQKFNPLATMRGLQQYILVDDSVQLIEYMFNKKNQNCDGLVIDFVLDNAGMELFSDLCLAHFLCATKLVKKIHFYVKRMPWYVSDVTGMDFVWMIDAAKNLYRPQQYVLNEVAKVWRQYINDLTWTLETELFWTYPLPFSEMKEKNPSLYDKLSKSDLLIFKGDLNYRKLTSDRLWHSTTSFDTALCGFNPSPLCALRTISSDVIVGLSQGQANAIGRVKKDWLISGEFALIQFSQIIQ